MENNPRIRKIPVAGFIIRCIRCGSGRIIVENRQDGTDFRCQACGNKLLLRPGEVLTIQLPNPINAQKVEEKAKNFEKGLENVPMDDWPGDVLEKWISDHDDKLGSGK